MFQHTAAGSAAPRSSPDWRGTRDDRGGGLGPRTMRWTHSVLRMTLDHAIADNKLRGKNPAASVRFPPMRQTSHVYLTAVEVAKLAELCDTATGEDSRAAKQGDVVLILAYT